MLPLPTATTLAPSIELERFVELFSFYTCYHSYHRVESIVSGKFMAIFILGDIPEQVYVWRWQGSSCRFWPFLWFQLCICTKWLQNSGKSRHSFQRFVFKFAFAGIVQNSRWITRLKFALALFPFILLSSTSASIRWRNWTLIYAARWKINGASRYVCCVPVANLNWLQLSWKMTQRLDMYAKSLTAAAAPGYTRQTIAKK